MTLSRRTFLGGSGAPIVSFGLLQTSAVHAQSARVPQIDPKQVDSWLAVAQDGRVTIFSGRVELGTGTRTALAQIAAEELYLPVDGITMVQGDTARTPDEGYTAGSMTIQVGGVNVRKAAAEARQALLEMASARLGVPLGNLSLADGVISTSADPPQRISYGDLIGNQVFNRPISDQTPLKNPSLYTLVGQSVSRLDLPGKVFGAPTYVQDVRLPDMLHGRTIHPAAIGATLASVDDSSVDGISDLVKVVRNGDFVGVVTRSEWGAIQAARKLQVTYAAANLAYVSQG